MRLQGPTSTDCRSIVEATTANLCALKAASSSVHWASTFSDSHCLNWIVLQHQKYDSDSDAYGLVGYRSSSLVIVPCCCARMMVFQNGTKMDSVLFTSNEMKIQPLVRPKSGELAPKRTEQASASALPCRKVLPLSMPLP